MDDAIKWTEVPRSFDEYVVRGQQAGHQMFGSLLDGMAAKRRRFDFPATGPDTDHHAAHRGTTNDLRAAHSDQPFHGPLISSSVPHNVEVATRSSKIIGPLAGSKRQPDGTVKRGASVVIDLTGEDPEKENEPCSEAKCNSAAPTTSIRQRPTHRPQQKGARLHHGLDSVPVERLPSNTGSVSGENQTKEMFAVKVGWFPGIHSNEAVAKLNTKHYPRKEMQTFSTVAQARQWMAQPSSKARLDAASRPKNFERIDKAAFMRYVAQTWAEDHNIPGIGNKIPGFGNKDIMERLQYIYKSACECEHYTVDWRLQPLPHQLFREDRNISQTLTSGPSFAPTGLVSWALKAIDPNAETLVEGTFAIGDVPGAPGVAPRPAPAGSGWWISYPSGIPPSPVPSHQMPPKPNSLSTSAPPEILICSCKEAVHDLSDAVTCANSACAFGTFHKGCVGLGSRKSVDGWRCWQCRPKPAPGLFVPRSSQLPSSSQLPPSSQQAQTNQPPPQPLPKFTVVPTSHIDAEPELHPEQARVVDCIMQGANVFYTGSAGTGKSTVLKSFVTKLKKLGKKVDIVAPSGIAALNVAGMTIFAYAGWHPDSFKEPLEKFVQKSHGKNVRKRLCTTDVLVIDEISMVERDLLIRLDTMMREVRTGWVPERGHKKLSPHNPRLPFGGAQVVITGDFCQLPPVKPFKFCMHCGGDELPGHSRQDGKPLTCPRCRKVYEDRDKWAFRSPTWEACNFTCIELRHIHRQSDKRFIDILQKCRYGQPLLPADKSLLVDGKPDPIGAVKLLPTRNEVMAENSKNFNNLQTPKRSYECLDVFMWRNKSEPDLQRHGTPRWPNRPDGPLQKLADHHFEEIVHLKEGMLVILLVNLSFETGLVNGSQGKIIGFESHDDAKVFPPQAPTSSSPRKGSGRARAKDHPLSELEIIREEQIHEFITRNSPPQTPQWPIVEFQNGVVAPIYAQCQLSELGSEKPYSLLGRTQVPLLAAWAITVHKSQGMTLNRVIVDLAKSFEREMVYVALSRARNLEGLKVVRLASERELGAGVNEEVKAFLMSKGLGGY